MTAIKESFEKAVWALVNDGLFCLLLVLSIFAAKYYNQQTPYSLVSNSIYQFTVGCLWFWGMFSGLAALKCFFITTNLPSGPIGSGLSGAIATVVRDVFFRVILDDIVLLNLILIFSIFSIRKLNLDIPIDHLPFNFTSFVGNSSNEVTRNERLISGFFSIGSLFWMALISWDTLRVTFQCYNRSH